MNEERNHYVNFRGADPARRPYGQSAHAFMTGLVFLEAAIVNGCSA